VRVWSAGSGVRAGGGFHLWLIRRPFHLFHETPETPDVGHDGFKAVLKETLEIALWSPTDSHKEAPKIASLVASEAPARARGRWRRRGRAVSYTGDVGPMSGCELSKPWKGALLRAAATYAAWRPRS